MPANDLDAYGRDYDPEEAAAIADGAIRASDLYVLRRDPLRARAVEGGRAAAVRLGVDAGRFYCGHVFAELCARAEAAGERRPRVGFIHVPPDRGCGARAEGDARLHARAVNIAQIGRVVATALREMAGETGNWSAILSGFGPFEGVVDNPTAAFVGEGAAVAAAVALAFPGAAWTGSTRRGAAAEIHDFMVPGARPRRLEVIAGVLALATSAAEAAAGRYVGPARIAAEVEGLWTAAGAAGPTVALGLGVDSSQLGGALPPTFKIEVQTWGWQGEGGRRRNTDLARAFLEVRGRGEGLLDFEA